MAALRASAFIQVDFPPSGRPAVTRRAERLLDAVEPHRVRQRRARRLDELEAEALDALIGEGSEDWPAVQPVEVESAEALACCGFGPDLAVRLALDG
jgi:hypothetical protein